AALGFRGTGPLSKTPVLRGKIAGFSKRADPASKSGTVEVVKNGVQIASVSAPGSVFGEQAVLLDQPHTADVRTLEQSEFYVADAPAILAGDPTVTLYVAAILARRLDAANRWLVAGKPHHHTGSSPSLQRQATD